MLYPDVCECGTVRHDVCETIDGSVTVCADFINGVIDPFAVRGQRKVMPETKPAVLHSVMAWYCEF